MSTRDCARCNARTKQGSRCTRNTCKYAKMCWQHAQAATNLKIAKSGIRAADDGLFAMKKIKKGKIIGRYDGKIVTAAAFERHPSDYGVQIPGNRVVDARSTQSSLARYANNCHAAGSTRIEGSALVTTQSLVTTRGVFV